MDIHASNDTENSLVREHRGPLLLVLSNKEILMPHCRNNSDSQISWIDVTFGVALLCLYSMNLHHC